MPPIRYLRAGHYYGVADSRERVETGIALELAAANIGPDRAHFIVTEQFVFGETPQFDHVWGGLVFTRLTLNGILRCTAAVRQRLKADGVFHVGFIESESVAGEAPIIHPSGQTSFRRSAALPLLAEGAAGAGRCGRDACGTRRRLGRGWNGSADLEADAGETLTPATRQSGRRLGIPPYWTVTVH